MKNVLVLTDFSAGAMRAAESALPIAAKLGAEVLLVNAYPITPYLPPVGSAIIPQRSADDKRRESTGRLNNEARRLVNRLLSLGLPGDTPAIRTIALEGRLADGVSELARRKKSVLIIMGVSERSYGDLLFDGEVKAVLQLVACPVLVIPAGWPGPEIGHIIFATDLAQEDERVIAELVRLSARLKARVSLSHVSRPVLIPDFAEELRTSSFTDRIMHLYPGIGCSNLRAANVMGALEQLSTEKHADVIGLRYRKHPVWYRLFNENPLKEAIQHGQTPLLIFPENPGHHD